MYTELTNVELIELYRQIKAELKMEQEAEIKVKAELDRRYKAGDLTDDILSNI